MKIKICGLSRIEDIEAVNRVLPDYIGFVFAPSRRRIDAQTAAMLKKNLDTRIKAVGVFVNEETDVVSELYKSGTIDIVQLHGEEDDGYVRKLKEICGCTVIKSIGIGDTIPTLPNLPDYLLFDTLSQQKGGTGRAFDWEILKKYCGLPYFLAGGLTTQNVTDAIRILSPYCADVSSGVETDGKKDAEKIEKFAEIVRSKQ